MEVERKSVRGKKRFVGKGVMLQRRKKVEGGVRWGSKERKEDRSQDIGSEADNEAWCHLLLRLQMKVW